MIFDNQKSETRKKVVEAAQINSFTKEASELFRDKPFAEANKVPFIAAKVIGIVAQIISVFLSVNFASNIFNDLLPTFLQNYYFITFLSCLILGIIEYAKRFTIKGIAVSYFKKSLNLGNILLFLVLFGVSIYAAVTGAVEYTKTQNDKSKDITDATKDELQDVSSDYKSQIKAAQKELKEFKQSVSWHGAINTSDKKIMDLIASKQAHIASLQNALERDKDDIRKSKDAQLVQNTAKVATSSVRIFCFSLTVEMVSLLCIGFIYYFLGTTHIDNFIDGNSPTVAVNSAKTVETVPKTVNSEEFRTVTVNGSRKINDGNSNRPNGNSPTITGIPPCDNGSRLPIGFNNQRPTVTERATVGKCLNCEKEFERKNPRKIYCSKPCGQAHWQSRNGVTLFGEKLNN
jgi:F0F1-type ATP synthase membrane subunit b/b'